MLGLKKDWVRTIAKAATKTAAQAKRANYIQFSHLRDTQEVRVQVFLDGEPASWINYNAEQLDELIRQAQMFRNEIKP